MEYRSQIKPRFGTPLDLKHWSNKGLVAGYAMNEFGGDKIFAVSEGSALPSPVNAGTLTSMAPMSPTSGWVPGPHGAALAFDGVQSVFMADSINWTFGLADFAIIVWIYPKSIEGYKAWIGANPNQYIYFGDNGTGGIYFLIGNGAWYEVPAATANLIINNKLQQVVVSRLAGIVSIYYEGIFVVSRSQPQSIDPPNLMIGMTDTGSNHNYGLISSVSIYNRALSAEEISYLYAFPWCGYEDEKGMQEWMYQKNIAVLDNYYRQMRAA